MSNFSKFERQIASCETRMNLMYEFLENQLLRGIRIALKELIREGIDETLAVAVLLGSDHVELNLADDISNDHAEVCRKKFEEVFQANAELSQMEFKKTLRALQSKFPSHIIEAACLNYAKINKMESVLTEYSKQLKSQENISYQ